MNQCDIRDDVLYLVGLKVADKMPFNVFGQDFVLVAHLKGFVLAKETLSCIVGFPKVFNGFGLGNGDETCGSGNRGKDGFKRFLDHGRKDI